MKNLNELGVQEMNAIEVKKMNGGFNDRPLGEPSGPSQVEIDFATKEDNSWGWAEWFLFFSMAGAQ